MRKGGRLGGRGGGAERATPWRRPGRGGGGSGAGTQSRRGSALTPLLLCSHRRHWQTPPRAPCQLLPVAYIHPAKERGLGWCGGGEVGKGGVTDKQGLPPARNPSSPSSPSPPPPPPTPSLLAHLLPLHTWPISGVTHTQWVLSLPL